jgi:hypothetical protein
MVNACVAHAIRPRRCTNAPSVADVAVDGWLKQYKRAYAIRGVVANYQSKIAMTAWPLIHISFMELHDLTVQHLWQQF